MRGRWPVSFDALLFALLAAAYLPTRFIIVLPPIIPGDTGATALLILAVGVYWTLDVIGARSVRAQRIVTRGKWLLLILAITLIVIAPTIMIIFLRHQSAPYLYAHDGLLQTEAAVRFVLAGQNPYVENYTNTPMALAPFHLDGLTVNPALEHYVYLPLTFLLPLPLQALAEMNGGWFDQRFIHLVFFLVMLVASARLTDDPAKRLILAMALSLNPLFVGYFIEGRNDVIVLMWLIVTIGLARHGRMKWAALTLGLACATKHPAWLFVPLFFIYASGAGTLTQRLNRIKGPLIVLAITTGLIVLPWLLWNPAAFVDDVVGYLAGSSASSYPISGAGFGAGLVSIGIIPSDTASFPFWLFQIGLGLPILVILVRRQWRRPNLPEVVAGSGLLLFILQYFSRLFNDNYLGVIIAIMAVAALMDENSLASPTTTA
jgi:hypothetical protein